MYKLFTDKSENFECNLELEGASLKQSMCRLIVESADWSLVFDGEISSNGDVKIPIKKLRGVFDEGTTGTLKLEVIADSESYFKPWEGKFEVKASKKVKVSEIKGATATPKFDKVKVTIKTPERTSALRKPLVKETLRVILKNNITKSNYKNNISYINELVENIGEGNNLSESDKKVLKKHIYNYIKQQ